MVGKLIDKFGIAQVSYMSIVKYKDGVKDLLYFMKKYGPFNSILEIGTFRAVSSIIMSEHCKKLITIDIEEQSEAQLYIDYLGISNIYRVILKKEFIHSFIKGIHFDFAFIDGWHFDGCPKKDFEAVKKCGMVLFHDCFDCRKFNEINDLVDSLNVTEKTDGFALWRSN